MAQPRMLFVNLPVRDLEAATAFFAALDFAFDEKFTGESCSCMVLNDQAYVMLLSEERFADFTTRPTVDAREATESILCLSAADREGVDALADAALAAGGTQASASVDHGFMYGRSFHDLDGHHWEVMWMDAAAVEQGPAEFAEQQA